MDKKVIFRAKLGTGRGFKAIPKNVGTSYLRDCTVHFVSFEGPFSLSVRTSYVDCPCGALLGDVDSVEGGGPDGLDVGERSREAQAPTAVRQDQLLNLII